jgi:glycosyltransferase involved in cell wall biosynthesis
MPSVLFVALHRPNRSPSQRFRYEQYLQYLAENGFEHDFSYLLNEVDDKAFYSKGNYLKKLQILLKSIEIRLFDIVVANRYDIILVQREAFMLGTAIFEKLYARSKAKLIFDFDDSIWLHNVSEANKMVGFLKSGSKTKEIIAVADMVFAGNQYLANYALQFNKNVKIIPTTVDTDKFVPVAAGFSPQSVDFVNSSATEEDSYGLKSVATQDADKVIEIGWTGSFSTIEHLRFGLPILYAMKEKYGEKITFKVIGDSSFTDTRLGIQGIAWNSETEVADLQTIDIGIMPLPDNEWTRGKCGFKGLTYMSLGIPTVMAAVGVNNEIIADGENGFLATTEASWIEKLSLLVENQTLRQTLGRAGRQTVIDRYSIHAQKDRYLQYFREVLEK